MRLLQLLCLLPLLSLAACTSIQSGLNIEAGEQFELGENQHGDFRATVRNQGAVATTVLTRAFGVEREVQVLQPGEITRLSVGAGTTAIFRNTSAGAAQLQVNVRGDTGLSMGYSPVRSRSERFNRATAAE